eukprot:6535854-Prymnesium_polylepis.1
MRDYRFTARLRYNNSDRVRGEVGRYSCSPSRFQFCVPSRYVGQRIPRTDTDRTGHSETSGT